MKSINSIQESYIFLVNPILWEKNVVDILKKLIDRAERLILSDPAIVIESVTSIVERKSRSILKLNVCTFT